MKARILKCMAALLAALLALSMMVACETTTPSTNNNETSNGGSENKEAVVEATVPSPSSPTLYVSNLTVRPGTQTVDVKIYVLGNPGINGLGVYLSYDNAMVLKSISYNADFKGTPSLLDDKNPASNPQLFNWINAESDITESGVYATATFDISGVPASTTSIDLTLSLKEATNNALEDVSFDIINGKITFAE